MFANGSVNVNEQTVPRSSAHKPGRIQRALCLLTGSACVRVSRRLNLHCYSGNQPSFDSGYAACNEADDRVNCCWS